jgi:hypothetical protein
MSEKAGITFELKTNVTVMNEKIEAALQKALNRIAIKWQAESRKAAPVNLGRLRASIAFSTPTNNALHTAAYKGGVVQYQPPAVQGLTAQVGSNVEYAMAVHEGFSGVVQVQKHERTITKLFGKRIPARTITIRGHTRKMNRDPNKFIETPGRDLNDTFKGMVDTEVRKATPRGRS